MSERAFHRDVVVVIILIFAVAVVYNSEAVGDAKKKPLAGCLQKLDYCKSDLEKKLQLNINTKGLKEKACQPVLDNCNAALEGIGTAGAGTDGDSDAELVKSLNDLNNQLAKAIKQAEESDLQRERFIEELKNK